ncbi:NUDIX hydrolase [Antrihabitans stalactiti]|uniref:CoA pyrophosphatase n=1 Tax=Antrihabitans stalactiti TaxID=2584121 RepID=A0A848KET5_9NOCA|nr:CoA pyrophosphatase [Antrihabitans stalactiti]NMN94670.1 CoA pyrophosphatase [Antrihabitans stalactiti]
MGNDAVDLDAVLSRVAEHRPRIEPPATWHAATALVFTAKPEPQFIVIRRSVRQGDMWSGHAALPGGRADPSDQDVVATARRETFEEVGVTLGDAVGRLDDIAGRMMKGVVSTAVFVLDEAVPFTPDPAEVAAAYWVPLSLLSNRAARVRHPHRLFGPWPAWEFRTGEEPPHDKLIIWGLTHRILSSLPS